MASNPSVIASPKQRRAIESLRARILQNAQNNPHVSYLEACLDGSSKRKDIAYMAFDQCRREQTNWPEAVREQEFAQLFSLLRTAAGWERFFKGQGAISWLTLHVSGQDAGHFSASIHRFRAGANDDGDQSVDSRRLGLAPVNGCATTNMKRAEVQ